MNNKLISAGILFFTWCVPAMVSAQNTFPATGNVGIGTATPQEKLDLKGNIRINDNTIYLRGAGDNNHGIAFRGSNPFAGQAIDGPVAFGWNSGALGTIANGEKIALRWNENGNVGIGTNTLSERLTVNGKISIEVPSAYGNFNYTMKLGKDGIDTYDPSGRGGGLRLNFNNHGAFVSIGDWTKTTDTYLRVAGYIEARTVNIGGTSTQPNVMQEGSPHADYKLAVNGKIVAKSVYVTITGWGDFVFDKNYRRMNWLEKKNFFETHKHLPGLLKAEEIEQNGVNMSETLKHVTINVEENSLDIIDLYERLEKLEAENMQLKKELTGLKNRAGK